MNCDRITPICKWKQESTLAGRFFTPQRMIIGRLFILVEGGFVLMMIGVVLTIWLVLMVVIFPGYLLLSLISELYAVDKLLLSPGIGIALFVVVSSGVVSIWGYSYWSVLFANVILGILLVSAYCMARGFRDDFKNILRINLSKEAFVFVVFFLLLVIFAVWTLMTIEIPGDVDAQGFGYLALTVRMGGTVNTLAPFYPKIKWLYSPGFFILVAFLSDLLSTPINYAMLGIAYFLWLMTFPAALSVGRQFGDNRLGLLICAFLVIGRGLFSALADSGFTSVLGCLIIFVCFSTFFKALDNKSNRIGNVIIAALALSSLFLSHPDSFIFFVLAEVPFFATVWLSKKSPNLQDYTVMLLIPSIAFLLTLLWLILQLPLFLSESIGGQLRYSPGIHILREMVSHNGAIVPLVAVLGMCLGSLRREKRDVFLITWVLMIIDFSTFSIINDFISLFLPLRVSLYIYAFGLGWRGPIVPFSILAAQFTHYAVRQITCTNPKTIIIQNLVQLRKKIFCTGPKGGVLLVLSITSGMIFPIYTAPTLADDVTRSSWHYLHSYLIWPRYRFSTSSDLAAMRWIKNNTPEDAFILNSPWYNGHWVPVITERKTVFFRNQPFFDRSDDQGLKVMWDECERAFFNPDCEESREIIYKYSITYVIVPDRKRGRIDEHYYIVDHNAFDRTSYLVLTFKEGNAKVYRVIDSRS